MSNAWYADDENVKIYINRDNNSFVVKDDGIGMSGDDFQNKFLKIGYSKRK
ncbi:MAG: ATP-binding protein, partial [Candidatus Margulisiibacteriota bacterium]